MTLSQFLTWLFASGGSAVVASFILERSGKYQELASEARKWVFFVVAAVIALAGYFTVTYVPTDILNQIAPIFTIVAMIFTTVFLGTKAHEFDKLTSKKQ